MAIITRKNLNQFLEIEVYQDIGYERNLLVKMVKRFLYRRLRPSTRIVYLIRKMQYYYFGNRLKKLYAIYLHKKIWNLSSCYISPLAKIGQGLKMPHPLGIVIGGESEIGENVTIYQGVTIGSRHKGDYEKGKQPKIRDEVTCFDSCKVLGDIIIGRNSVIGAGSVVIRNVPENSVAVGVPAKIIKK